MTVLRTAYVNVLPKLDRFEPELRRGLGAVNVNREGQRVGRAFADAAGRAFQEHGRTAFQGLRSAPTIRVDVDTADARGRLDEIARRTAAMARQSVRVDVDVDSDRATRGLSRISESLSRHLGSGASSMFDRFSGLATSAFDAASQSAVKFGSNVATSLASAAVGGATMTASTGGANIAVGALAVTALGAAAGVAALATGFTALAPVVLATGGAIGAATTAIAGGIAAAGVFKLGLSGIGEALGAMDTAQKDTTKSGGSLAGSQSAVASAMDSVRSAMAAQANTRRTVTDQARRSAQQVADSERDLTVAQREARDITRELDDARRQAARSLADLNQSVKENALSQRQANLDVAEAKRELDKVLADPKATQAQREQAQLTYERQVLQQEDLKRRGKELAEDQRKATKAGIDGSAEVLAVRDRIAQANERVGAAERRVAEARRSQAEQARQGQFQLAQAAQAVASAQRAVRQASASAGAATGGASTAVSQFSDAMADLSPNARQLVMELNRLKGPFGELRRSVQDRLLAGVAGQVRNLARVWLPELQTMLGGLAGRFNQAGDRVFAALGRRDFISNIGVAVAGFGAMVDRIGRSVPGVIDAFGRLAAASTPVLSTIGDLIGGILDKFSRWIKVADQSGALDQFMKDAAQSLRDIFSIGGLVIGIVGDIIKIFFPGSQRASETFLGGVKVFLEGIRAWLQDPENQQKVREWVTAIQDFVSKVATVWIPRFAAMIGTIDGWVTRVSGWVGVFTGFGGTVRGVFGAVGSAVQAVWSGAIAPALRALRSYVVDVLGPVFRAFYNGVIKPNWERIRITFSLGVAAAKVSLGVFQIAIKAAGAVFRTLYSAFVKPVWDLLRPIFTTLGTYVRDRVVPAFRAGVSAIGKAWDGLKERTKAPIRFVVQTVLNNGLLAAYNRVAKVFGVKPDNVQVPLPKGFAFGGFVSGPGGPREDRIPAMLSNGEYVIPAHVVRGLGVGFFDQLIGRPSSRRPGDGSEGLAFADGGLVGFLKDVWTGITNPRQVLTAPLNAMVDRIPGAGAFRDLAAGMGRKLIGGLTSWLTGAAGGSIGGNVGRALAFVRAQAGKPYIWAGVGPAGYDCSGIGSAVLNVLRGRSPHSRLFSTHNEASFFTKPGPGVFTAAWANAGERGGGSVGHTAFRLGNLQFESRGGDGVVLGPRVTPLSSFAHLGHYARGGLIGRLPFGSYDSGGYLPPGLSLAHNGTGRPERVGGGNTYQITVQVPPSANQAEVGRQVVEAIKAFEAGSGNRWRTR